MQALASKNATPGLPPTPEEALEFASIRAALRDRAQWPRGLNAERVVIECLRGNPELAANEVERKAGRDREFQ